MGIYAHILRACDPLNGAYRFQTPRCDLALIQIDRCLFLLYSFHAAIGPLISFRPLQDTSSYGYGKAPFGLLNLTETG